jgi:IclR family KDG regulon transcriptional repressor
MLVEKIHNILKLLSENSDCGLTNIEISSFLNIPSPTSYRILKYLKMYGYVTQRPEDKHYFLGLIHLSYAESVWEANKIINVALPFLEQLHAETDETTHLSLFNGESAITVYICGHYNSKLSMGIGEKINLHSNASGKAILAFLTKEKQKDICSKLIMTPYTPYTITCIEKLNRCLKCIRKTGLSFSFEEQHIGLNAISSPIFNRENRIIGAVTIVGNPIDLDRNQMLQYAEGLVESAEIITFKMGGEYPERITNIWGRENGGINLFKSDIFRKCKIHRNSKNSTGFYISHN